MSGIKITEVRVRNYRCLCSVDVTLDKLIVLLGPNNAGKTSFLQALYAAIGVGQKSIHPEDIFLRKTDRSTPKNRVIAIDILIKPTNADGAIIDAFPEGSPWLELWGTGVVQDSSDHDIVSIRTTYQWNAVKGEYVLERRFLKTWNPDPTKWADAKPLEAGGIVGTQHLEPLGLHFLDAQRDIAEDLKSRSSFWGKMVEDHGLSEESIDEIESSLTDINKLIVEGSAVFTHIQGHLEQFHETLSCDQDGVSITPMPRHLRDLSRGMDVVLSTSGAPPFPLDKQGMGTRSLGTFFTFWAYTTWRQKQAKTAALHPFMAMEEPECHLHPQAQRALFRQIKQMPGQRIISTHSPHICGLAEIASMRHFSKQGEETVVTQLASDAYLSEEDLRKIDRQVMNTRGDMLFARVLVFFEGETEEQALPDFAEKFWGRHPHDLSFAFIGTGGSGNYLPFLRLALTFHLPWYIFSDGEPKAIANVNAALTKLNEPEIPNNPRVVVLPGGDNFESYISKNGEIDLIIADDIQRIAQNDQERQALEAKWAARSLVEKQAELLKYMKASKTQYGSRLGKLLAVPNPLEDLFKKIEAELTPPAAVPPPAAQPEVQQ
jgi:putative ATP-dependent endonuclease of the OLD family